MLTVGDPTDDWAVVAAPRAATEQVRPSRGPQQAAYHTAGAGKPRNLHRDNQHKQSFTSSMNGEKTNLHWQADNWWTEEDKKYLRMR